MLKFVATVAGSILWACQTMGLSDEVAATPEAPRFPFTFDAARDYQSAVARQLQLPVEVTNRQGMRFVLVPPGTFVMGSAAGEPDRHDAETPHQVTLTRPIYLGKFEVTRSQFQTFVMATDFKTDVERNGGGHAHDELAVWKHRPGTSWRRPGYAAPHADGDDHPVVHVSHADALAYCRWLDVTAGNADGRRFAGRHRLPSEAEWEWACRAGSDKRFWWGNDVDESGRVANVGDRALKRAHAHWPRTIMPMDDGHAFVAPVGSYRANGFGLHDMLGNVWEFCSTRHGPYPQGRSVDPGDLGQKDSFSVRGGGWSNVAADCRCATRNSDPPHFGHSNLGFRVALEIPPTRP